MKTLANCTPREFAVQTNKIANRIKKYSDGMKRIKEKFADNENHEDVFEIISYICDDNIDETMELCGELCFMSGEEFGNLDPTEIDERTGEPKEDGIAALVEILNSKRCIRFFTTLLSLSKFIEKL